ncbi:MAG: protein-disulfide reductase DsbD domain-containing protein [Minwuia sp.]|uniref:protein-disulfide reductase DsbD domain-containing protein n=1 Tax=Minwuia sp. TaxID=2493630 RepID=UPI003A8B1A13
MRSLRSILIAAGLLAAAGTASASEFASNWAGIAEAEVRLIAGRTPDGQDMLGMHFAMAPHWKIYWRSPGDAGFPPQPDWSGTEGVGNERIAWPIPKHFVFYGLETYGYENEAVLPVRIERDGAARIRLNLVYAACAEICVPAEAALTLDLPGGDWPVNRHGATIADALLQVPERPVPAPSASAMAMPDGVVKVELQPGGAVTSPGAIFEPPAGFVLARPACEAAAAAVRCQARILDAPGGRTLDGETLTVTLHDRGWALETDVTVDKRAR